LPRWRPRERGVRGCCRALSPRFGTDPIGICFGWAAALEGLTAKEPEKLLRIADIKAIVVAAS